MRIDENAAADKAIGILEKHKQRVPFLFIFQKSKVKRSRSSSKVDSGALQRSSFSKVHNGLQLFFNQFFIFIFLLKTILGGFNLVRGKAE